MKKYAALPVTALAGGAAAFTLRLLQNRTGFEADTGLPLPGNPYRYALIALLAVLAVLFVLLARRLPEEQSPAFPDAFTADSPGLLTLPVMGVFLTAASGAFNLYSGLLAGGRKMELLLGALGLVSAACLFPVVAACRRREAAPPLNGALLLSPVVCLVVRLVVAYREDSINPSLSAYYVELLALVLLTLGFYRLSSFAFQAGQTRRFALYALPAVVLSIATLADGHGPAGALLYAGGALVLLGFLLLRLNALTQPRDNL